MSDKVKSLISADWRRPLVVSAGDFVICVRSNDPSCYAIGDVMQARESRHGGLSLFHVTREGDTRAFGGYDGAWEPYYIKQSLEELL